MSAVALPKNSYVSSQINDNLHARTLRAITAATTKSTFCELFIATQQKGDRLSFIIVTACHLVNRLIKSLYNFNYIVTSIFRQTYKLGYVLNFSQTYPPELPDSLYNYLPKGRGCQVRTDI